MRFLIVVLFFTTVMFNQLSGLMNRETDDFFPGLFEKAQQNIEKLPPDSADRYHTLLDKHPDVFMAYFLAYEEGSKLLLADTTYISDHYRKVKELWAESSTKYTLPFFLSYIAKITVTDERITPYRTYFAEYGIFDLLQRFSNEEELVRELNLWCRQFMTFVPTSGRDMAPYDILKRTNIGRCEEMQIFFISAARTLGIPARPAMTPLWAHTDNNHAWVEVYVNGRWRYLGAVEPAYELDEAWFSANAARAVMIIATSAFPDSSDIILREDDYYSLINSTPNYDTGQIRSRKVSLLTKNEKGDILPEVNLAFMVYNWGMLRPIFRAETADDGSFSIITGSGSFLIAASNDSLFALYEIPAQPADYETEIILKDEKTIALNALLRYPDPQLPARVDRPEWNDYRVSFEDRYNEIVSVYLNETFPHEVKDTLLIEIWSKCRNNKESFLTFYEKNKPLPEHFLAVLNGIDPKFLWQANLRQWQNLYDFYTDLISEATPFSSENSDEQNEHYSEEILSLLISPTVLFEELPFERMTEDLTRWRKGDVEERISGILDYMNQKYEKDNERAVSSLLPYDRAISLSLLTDYQFKMLFCSVLRANFIPANYTRIPNIVNIFHNNNWQYYNIEKQGFQSPEKTEEEISHTVIIGTVDENNYQIELPTENYTLTFLQNGIFYPYSNKPVSENGNLMVNSAESKLYLHIGYRISSNETRFYLKTIDSGIEDTLKKSIILHDYPRKWNRLTDELTELLVRLETITEPNDQSLIILLGDIDNEPIRRTADKLDEQITDQSLLWLGTKEIAGNYDYYQVSGGYVNWLNDYPYMRDRVITIYYEADEGEWTFFDGFWDSLPE